MPRSRRASPQTIEVMVAIARRGGSWAYGYDIARETGLKSGSLYPILARLAEQGWLIAKWEEAAAPGRPARHLYRLTSTGTTTVRELEAARTRAEPTPGTPRTAEA